MTKRQKDLQSKISKAIAYFWKTRKSQVEKQNQTGRPDQGYRGAVTGGAQMDGFINLITEIIESNGIDKKHIFYKKSLELPGYFRPTKEWDLLVVKDNQLIIAMEAKSQVGPSFGNNFNNRTEEAIGSALDLWTAYREGAFNKTIKPWLGYLFMLEDCTRSQSPVTVKEPHFEVFPEFKGASYAKRYEIFCRKILRERHYNSACFITSRQDKGLKGDFAEPVEDLKFESFANSLRAQILAYGS
jgi:hypothetical protein